MAVDAKPAISVIVPCLDQAVELESCLRGLDAQATNIPFEAIVVDSASDPAVAAVASRHPRVRLLRGGPRLSAGEARNLGAREATAEYLAFIDADCIAQSAWVENAVISLRAGAVLVSGAVADALPWHFISASDNRLQFADFPPRRRAGWHPYLPAANLALTRRVFNEFGPFDEQSAVAQDVLFTGPVARAYPDRALFQPRMIVRHIGRTGWHEYLAHQHAFGFSRTENHLRMDRTLEWMARHPAMGPAVALRRLAYIGIRVVQWNLPDLPRFLLQVPILIAGLAAWTRGFYAGTRTQPRPNP